jgi:hypothetical protein
MRAYESFNQSRFSHFINSPAGRIFRLLAGTAFLIVGLLYRKSAAGLGALAWCGAPLTAGVFDVCYISAALGGPLSGAKIREYQRSASQKVVPQ